MALSVSRSLKQGFQAANRSLPAMGIFALGWILLSILMLLLAVFSGMPAELLQQPDAQRAEQQAAAPEAALAQLEGAATSAADSVSGQDAQAPDAALEALSEEAQRRAEIAAEWLAGAWPVLSISLLGFIAGSLWLQAGQISYMNSTIRDSKAALSTFWIGANRAILPLCFASLLALAAYVVGGGLIIALFALIGVLPGFLAAILGIVFVLGFFIGLVWLGVKLVFWFISIVAQGLGPVAGLKASFRATQGCWWRTCGLVAALGAISFGVSLIARILAQIGTSLGSGAGLLLGLIVVVINIAVGLYMGFFSTGAFIRGYMDQVEAVKASS